MKESDILFEKGDYFVLASKAFNGYEVYKNGATHATRCASIGYAGKIGLDKAIQEIERRLV